MVHRITLAGHLTEDALSAALAPVTASLGRAADVSLLIDVRTMTGYETRARELFVNWNRAHKKEIARVAILTDNLGWRAVIAAMALASGQKMRSFRTPEEAGPWLS